MRHAVKRSASFMFILLALLFAVASPSAADKSARKVDLFWTAPDIAAYDVRSIALLPVATFDGSLEARKATEQMLGQQFHASGHRWVSASITWDELQREGGDSLLKAVNDGLLKNPRVDSLKAPALSRLLRARALLSVRVDQFEKRPLEFNETGHPTTTVQLHAALVDSTGRLLWTASGSENMEGPYQDADTNTMGVKASGLNNMPMTNQGGPPSYNEVLKVLLTRWAEQFPNRASDSAAK